MKKTKIWFLTKFARIHVFFRLIRCIYLSHFKKKTYCPNKLALYATNVLKNIDDCRYTTCQYEASKKIGGCSCKKIQYGEIINYENL